MTQKLILASESPRRKQLLEQMGVKFETVVSNFDEQLDDERYALEVVQELALGKAKAVAALYPDVYVIGSDTVVVFEGRQLGKQSGEASARALLRRLSGQSIEVITAVVLVCETQNICELGHESATIVFERYGEDAIDTYIRSGDWRDKAAAVAVQSPGTPPIARMSGNYDTILGLATTPLAAMLNRHGVAAKPAKPVKPATNHTYGS